MTDQDSPIWERLGMEYDVSPPCILFNMAMALNIGMLQKPCIYRTARVGEPTIMLNNRDTYQQQSYMQAAPKGMQLIFIPVTYDKSCLVPNIVKEHKLYFNPCVISIMFTYGPPVHSTEPIH